MNINQKTEETECIEHSLEKQEHKSQQCILVIKIWMALWRWWLGWLPTNHIQQGSVWISLLILMQRKKNRDQETWLRAIWLNDEPRESRFAMVASRKASTDKSMIEIAEQIAEDATASYRCLVGKMYNDPKTEEWFVFSCSFAFNSSNCNLATSSCSWIQHTFQQHQFNGCFDLYDLQARLKIRRVGTICTIIYFTDGRW